MSNGSMQCGWCGSCLGHKGFGTADCEQRQSIVTLPTQSSSGDDEMSDDNRYSNHFVNESSGGDKGAMSDDQDIRRGYREHMRKIQGLPSQEPDPTPDPIAFDHTSVLKILFDHHNGYVPPRETDEITIQELLKLHNQSLQTAVVEALGRVLSNYDKKYQKLSVEYGVDRETPHTVFHELIEAELTKAKEVNNV